MVKPDVKNAVRAAYKNQSESVDRIIGDPTKALQFALEVNLLLPTELRISIVKCNQLLLNLRKQKFK